MIELMANKQFKYAENSPGAFYVDEECIACDACLDSAPNHFQMTADKDHAYVARQPETDSERTACLEALAGCPVDAIGQDGL